jgi:hypothetical protein
MRDWVFIGKPGDGLPSPRGWVLYGGRVNAMEESNNDALRSDRNVCTDVAQ